jgi:hypothetical protein
MTKDEDLLSIEQVAVLLEARGISRTTQSIRAAFHAGQLRGRRFGRSIAVTRASADAWATKVGLGLGTTDTTANAAAIIASISAGMVESPRPDESPIDYLMRLAGEEETPCE